MTGQHSKRSPDSSAKSFDFYRNAPTESKYWALKLEFFNCQVCQIFSFIAVFPVFALKKCLWQNGVIRFNFLFLNFETGFWIFPSWVWKTWVSFSFSIFCFDFRAFSYFYNNYDVRFDNLDKARLHYSVFSDWAGWAAPRKAPEAAQDRERKKFDFRSGFRHNSAQK